MDGSNAACVRGPDLRRPARREALAAAPVELFGAVVLIRRRGRRLPAVVELGVVGRDVCWPAGPGRRAALVASQAAGPGRLWYLGMFQLSPRKAHSCFSSLLVLWPSSCRAPSVRSGGTTEEGTSLW